MGKKYVPSGYQIIDLDVTLVDGTVTLEKNNSDDAEKLIELCQEICEIGIKKPILLNLHDNTSDLHLCSFPVIRFVHEDYARIECYFAQCSKYMIINHSYGDSNATLTIGEI